jgi:hypothetical protein
MLAVLVPLTILFVPFASGDPHATAQDTYVPPVQAACAYCGTHDMSNHKPGCPYYTPPPSASPSPPPPPSSSPAPPPPPRYDPKAALNQAMQNAMNQAAYNVGNQIGQALFAPPDPAQQAREEAERAEAERQRQEQIRLKVAAQEAYHAAEFSKASKTAYGEVVSVLLPPNVGQLSPSLAAAALVPDSIAAVRSISADAADLLRGLQMPDGVSRGVVVRYVLDGAGHVRSIFETDASAAELPLKTDVMTTVSTTTVSGTATATDDALKAARDQTPKTMTMWQSTVEAFKDVFHLKSLDNFLTEREKRWLDNLSTRSAENSVKAQQPGPEPDISGNPSKVAAALAEGPDSGPYRGPDPLKGPVGGQGGAVRPAESDSSKEPVNVLDRLNPFKKAQDAAGQLGGQGSDK